MSRPATLLGVIALLQLALTAWLFWPQSATLPGSADTALLALEAESIDRLIISDNETSTVVQKIAGQWLLPEYHQLPADPARVIQILETLPQLPRGWPVAQTSAASQRFEVADDRFQRKLEWVGEDQVKATLYLGTAPGFRQVNARAEPGQEIYAVTFNSFDAPARHSEWLDQALLQMKGVTGISGLDFTISADGESWKDESGLAVSAAEANKLVTGLAKLQVVDVVNLETAAMLRDTPAPPTLTVTAAGTSHDYYLYQVDETYYVKRSDIDIFFELSALDFERLNSVSAATLREAQEQTPEPEPNSSQAAVPAPMSSSSQ